MKIETLLSAAHVWVDVSAYDKSTLLVDLAGRAAVALNLPAERISDALLKREALGSTASGDGIAIPHARIPGLHKPFGMLVRLKESVDFDAIDGRPVDLLVLLLLPTDTAKENLTALAAVARLLRDREAVIAARRAVDAASLLRSVVKAES